MTMRLSRRRFLQAAGGALAFNPATARGAPRPLILSIWDDYLPMFDQLENGTWIGYCVDLAQELVDTPTTGLGLEYGYSRGWKRSFKSLKAGYFDMLFQTSYRPERLEFVDYIGPTDFETAWLVVLDSFEGGPVEVIDDFTRLGVKINVNKAPRWHPEFDRRLVEDPAFRAHFNIDDSADAIGDARPVQWGKMLSSGRAEAFLTGPVTGPSSVYKVNAIVDATGQGRPLKLVPVNAFGTVITNLCMSLETPESSRSIVRENYARTRADGSFERIWKKWYGDVAPPPHIPSDQT